MRVFDKEKISYSNLLIGIKKLVEENSNNEIFVSREKIDTTFDYLLELKNYKIQKFLIGCIKNIDERVTIAMPNDSSYDALHKLPIIVSLIRVVKDGGYGSVKNFTFNEMSTLAAVTWSASEEFYPAVVAVYAQKAILDRLLKKSENINDNLLLAIEIEKKVNINYKGDLKIQVVKMCNFLDSLDEKSIEVFLKKSPYIKR